MICIPWIKQAKGQLFLADEVGGVCVEVKTVSLGAIKGKTAQ